MRRFYVAILVLLGLSTQLYGGSFENYKRSCGEGDMQGCYHLGLVYADGNGVRKNLKNAKRFLNFSCDSGVTEACSALKDIGQHHTVINLRDKQDNDSKSVSVLVENNSIKEYVLGVIKQGSAQFNYPMGAMPGGLTHGSDAEDIAIYVADGMKGKRPSSFFCAECHGADGRGSGGLSADLLNLRGMKSRGVSGVKEEGYKDNCERGDSEACFELGLLYEDTRGNYIKAAEYYRKVCSFGDGLGCVFLGVLIEEGKGYESNYIKAAEYYKKACNLGEKSGCFNLGFLYKKGKGFERNHTQAEKYYKKACALGDKDGCAELNNKTINMLNSSNTKPKARKIIMENLKQYNNKRFGFSLVYPVDLFVTEVLSDNGDGTTLYNDDRSLELRAYGSWYGNSIRQIYRDEIKWAEESGKKVTYKVLKKRWFVLSGIDNESQKIFYQKTFYKNGKSTSFRLEYPVRNKEKYNALVSMINKSFRAE